MLTDNNTSGAGCFTSECCSQVPRPYTGCDEGRSARHDPRFKHQVGHGVIATSPPSHIPPSFAPGPRVPGLILAQCMVDAEHPCLPDPEDLCSSLELSLQWQLLD
jgi:hypothetical protein